MNRQTIHISIRYLSSLPAERDVYQLDDLESGDFPDFLIRRLKLELQRRSDQAMRLPKNPWADMQSQPVQQSWNHLLEDVHQTLYLPANKARPVVKEVVSEVLEILVQPRKTIPDVLFEKKKILASSALRSRLPLLVVYEHFSRVLEAYLKRKNKPQLNRERCREIIIQVDNKMTAGYTPQQWAQMLDPLFALIGSTIDTDLLRLFFEDRQMHRVAHRFDGMNGNITRAEFIEVLSSPELLNYDENEEDQTAVFNRADKQKVYSENMPSHDSSLEKKAINEGENKAKTNVRMEQEAHRFDKAEKSGEEQSALKKEQAIDKEGVNNNFLEMEDEQFEESPRREVERRALQRKAGVADGPVNPERPTNARPPKKMERKEESPSLNDVFAYKKEDKRTGTDWREPVATDASPVKPEQKAQRQGSPIWQQFIDHPPGNEHASDAPLSQNDLPITEDKLEHLFARRENYFINELFDGSRKTYRTTLRQIARKESWREVSALIRRDIFDRNNINIYSQAAVDFTDRLQDYFAEKRNHN